MRIVILETAHFQYALTQSELFSDCERFFITTKKIRGDMEAYSPELCKGTFFLINNIAENETEISDFIKNIKADLLLISPVFDSYDALKRIVKKISCKKVITTHNINTWFYGRFWSPNSLRDKINMKSIIKNCDYIAVEDFIYNHLKSTKDILFRKYRFIYIPFTIFHQHKKEKIKPGKKLKIVLTGNIDGDRRRYEDILEVINYYTAHAEDITFSFAGRAIGEYGKSIQNKLSEIRKFHPSLVSYFENDSTPGMFRHEMETSDLVLSVSRKTFKGMGTIEYIGKTKPTAAIHDMMTYELPGLLPSHLQVPPNLKGSVFNYNSVNDLIQIINGLLGDRELIKEWQSKAKQNSLNFTPEIIRAGLPF